jgi:TonB family protein
VKNFCYIFTVFSAIVLFSLVTAGQQTPPASIVSGVVNGKATSLVKPAYPPAAKAVRASGAVNVQVLIDEEGKVISASAISGHPLLRAAAVQAARQSTFLPTTLSGKPVKINGVIVYNFVGDALSPSQIGYALAVAEAKSELDANAPISQISYSIPTDWTEVKAEVARLQTKQSQSLFKRNQNVDKSVYRAQSNNSQQKVEDSKNAYIIAQKPSESRSEIKESHTEIIRNLTELLKNRYAGNVEQNWTFSLGLKLGKLQTQIEDEAALRVNLNELNVLAQSAPANVPTDFVTSLKTIVAYTNKAEIGTAEKAEIQNLVRRVQ